MRLAILSDIHANLQALLRVLERARGTRPDLIVCLGDIVGYGPFPNECIDLVRSQCSIIVRGNHDAGAVGELSPDSFNAEGKAAIEWTRKVLTAPNREFLQELPISAIAGDTTFAHASPRSPSNWDYVGTWQTAAEVFEHFSTRFCCIGHTHIPSIIAADGTVNNVRDGQKHLINAGSVGQPRDGNPRASFALLDTDRFTASIVRVDYDSAVTAEAIRRAGLPEFLAKRLMHGI